VFGLNMLSWWKREQNLDRAIGPIAEWLADGSMEPVVAEAFPFDRAGDAHMMIAERRNIGKVVLVPA
jgi:NADPH:quinone reductase-like Zn-dependent oxidoreductase